jgi:hypothetical protein
MDIIGKKVKLRFGEPWDDSRVIVGVVIKIHTSIDWRTYFLFEDVATLDKYLVTNRYVGDDVIQVSTKKEITVAVYLPKTSEFTFDDPNYFSHLKYYGYGLLEYIG